MFTKMKIAICVAVLAASATASFAKDTNAGRNASALANANSRHALAQAQTVRPNSMRQGRDAFANVPARAPVSGAEWWQSRGNADDMGLPYR